MEFKMCIIVVFIVLIEVYFYEIDLFTIYIFLRLHLSSIISFLTTLNIFLCYARTATSIACDTLAATPFS